MMKKMLRATLIAGVVFTMALGIAVEFANADTLKSMIAGAKKEKHLKVALHFITPEHVKKLETAFNARYGLNITLEANLTGKYSGKARKVVNQYREGAEPTFDAMVLNESAFAMMADAGALEKIEGWENLLPEGADPSVSPGPIAGFGFKSFDFYTGYSYRSHKVNGNMVPLSIKDLANASLKGKAAVSMYSGNLTYALMKYSPEELLAIAEAWSQNGVKKFHPRKMPKQVAQGNFFVGGFHTTEQYLDAGPQDGDFKMGFFKDLVPHSVLLHAVPKGTRSPNAAKLFVVWLTGREALNICGEGTYLGNTLKNGNQKAIAIAEQLMMKENVKPVSYFDSEENYKKLVWLGSPEGQKFEKQFGAAIKKSAK
jgi:ABC-type Fe3+ transport system substrate-binding protein